MALYIISAKYQSNFRPHISNPRQDFGPMGTLEPIRLDELFFNLNTTGLRCVQPNNCRVLSMWKRSVEEDIWSISTSDECHNTFAWKSLRNFLGMIYKATGLGDSPFCSWLRLKNVTNRIDFNALSELMWWVKAYIFCFASDCFLRNLFRLAKKAYKANITGRWRVTPPVDSPDKWSVIWRLIPCNNIISNQILRTMRVCLAVNFVTLYLQNSMVHMMHVMNTQAVFVHVLQQSPWPCLNIIPCRKVAC